MAVHHLNVEFIRRSCQALYCRSCKGGDTLVLPYAGAPYDWRQWGVFWRYAINMILITLIDGTTLPDCAETI